MEGHKSHYHILIDLFYSIAKRMILPVFLNLLLVHSLTHPFVNSSPSNMSDLFSLLAFKSQLENHHLLSNWNANTSLCNWIGVSCSLKHHRVNALNLSRMGLKGTISPYIGNLSFLNTLDLRNNTFHGPLPATVGHLYRLRLINVRYNRLEGTIPYSISRCQRLRTLLLGSNRFQGKIPDEIGNLPNLEILQVSENYLTGSFPHTLLNISTLRVMDLGSNNMDGAIPMNICHRLPKLEFLYLPINSFSGHIPTSICQCKYLREVDFMQNRLTGSIPRDIGFLSKLEHLNLARNQLTGTIPPSFGNMSKLTVLELINNNLWGEIPEELSHLPSISYLRIAFNRISGSIPRTIFNLSTARLISFMNNNLSGNVPEFTGFMLPKLEGLNLQGNQLQGRIPSSISNASMLTFLELSRNSFSGPVPMTLGDLGFLETLNLQSNQLSNEPSEIELKFLTSLTKCRELKRLVIGKNRLNGRIPASVGNLSTSLELFSADASHLKGSLPYEIGNLKSLLTFEVAGNDLTGTIPSSIGNLVRLQRLRLFRNKIEGDIPSGLCHLPLLGELLLHENNLSGTIPPCIGNLSQLQALSISSNSFSSIPESLWSLQDLWYLNLSSNSFRGDIPPGIGGMTFLEWLDMSKNHLSGSIQDPISNLRMLKGLNLSDNAFQGSIPQVIGNLTNLEYMDFSMNNLSGDIPKSFENLVHLIHLNLSFNKLGGEIPDGGVMGNFTVQSFLGNIGFCGSNPRLRLPPCPRTNFEKPKRETWLKYVLPPIAFVIIAFVLLIIYKIYVKVNKRSRSPQPSSLETGLSTEAGLKFISFNDLLRATNNFSEENLLGCGSSGSLYKATFPSTHTHSTTVAVKVLDLKQEGALRAFDAECQVMRNVRHRNLVKIITSCSNLDFRALVLEYMPNGSLEKLLYSPNPSMCLDMIQRMNIMIDVAMALEYLHHGYSEQVIHCDVKPSNVLLDQHMVAHLSDFGIAKILAKYNSVTQTSTLGTMGYIAPEYGMEGRVSTKGDVYSYGIMLMGTLTRRRPTDENFAGGMSLKEWVSSSFPNQLLHIVDNTLLTGHQQEDPCTSMPSYLRSCLVSILELALLCSRDSLEERPTMEYVVVRLTKIKKQYLLDRRNHVR